MWMWLAACDGSGTVPPIQDPVPTVGVTDCADTPWWWDGDDDGYGDPTRPVYGCDPGDAFAPASGDCDDDDPALHPDALEACNGLDDDCDADTPDECPDYCVWVEHSAGVVVLTPDGDRLREFEDCGFVGIDPATNELYDATPYGVAIRSPTDCRGGTGISFRDLPSYDDTDDGVCDPPSAPGFGALAWGPGGELYALYQFARGPFLAHGVRVDRFAADGTFEHHAYDELALSPPDDFALGADGAIYLPRGSSVVRIDGDTPATEAGEPVVVVASGAGIGRVVSVDLVANELRVLDSTGAVGRFDADTGAALGELVGPAVGRIAQLAMPDGRMLLLGSAGVDAFDGATGAPLGPFGPVLGYPSDLALGTCQF